MPNKNHTVGNWGFLHSAGEDVNIIKFMSERIRKYEQDWTELWPWDPAVHHRETIIYGSKDLYEIFRNHLRHENEWMCDNYMTIM